METVTVLKEEVPHDDDHCTVDKSTALSDVQPTEWSSVTSSLTRPLVANSFTSGQLCDKTDETVELDNVIAHPTLLTIPAKWRDLYFRSIASVFQTITFESLDVESSYLRIRCIYVEYESSSYMKVIIVKNLSLR